METKHASITNRTYEDFDPVCKSRREEGRDTIDLHLPGFKREQIRIQINHLGFMVITGERPIDGTRSWRRFKKQVELPQHCNVDAVYGNFSHSILTVVMPKKIPPPPVHRQEEEDDEIEKFRVHEDLEHKKKKKETITEEEEEEDNDDVRRGYPQQVVENGDVGLGPEIIREVAFKFMVVVFVILFITSYLADMSKSFMAQAQSYFHD